MTPAVTTLEEQMNSFNRFLELMPKGPDPELVILKGHLLIEERLRALIDAKVPNPKALEDARLTTHQVICIATSLYWAKAEPWLWDVLRKLNKLRNDIAHQVEAPAMDHRMKDIASSVKTTVYPTTGFGIDHPFIEFWLSLWVIHMCLLVLTDLPDDQTLQSFLS